MLPDQSAIYRAAWRRRLQASSCRLMLSGQNHRWQTGQRFTRLSVIFLRRRSLMVIPGPSLSVSSVIVRFTSEDILRTQRESESDEPYARPQSYAAL